MSYIYNNIQPENMNYSDVVLWHLYATCRIYKMHIVSAGAQLEDKSYKLIVRCDNNTGKGKKPYSYFQYYLHPSAFEVVEKALLEDYGIVVNRL